MERSLEFRNFISLNISNSIMKRLFISLIVFCIFTCLSAYDAKKIIRIGTDQTDLVLQVAPNGRLYQVYLGDKLLHDKELNCFFPYVKSGSDKSVSTRGWEVYAGSGAEDFFEPAVAITHSDGNPSTVLQYVSSEQKSIKGGIETVIRLKDSEYPVEVMLYYRAYPKENVIKTWSEIKHQEKKTIILWRYASTMLYFSGNNYYLTEFSSDWAKEAQMNSQQLQFGKRIIDTKLGSRAAMHVHPFFELGLEQPVQETQGRVLVGTMGWTGNFRFTFEVDNAGNLRVIPAINPYASHYELRPNELFVTPEFIFTYSNKGTGQASRNLHDWARNYQLKDGCGSRLTLLNNWENTCFDFNESLLADLMKEANHLGVDMFLLDDGWFGNKYPRNSDTAGLGDWEVMKKKLPGGIPTLVESAKKVGVKLGIWIEPEMVNPKSELFEKHPEWVISLPNRKLYYYRNQLVLDLSNPKVQDFVFGVVDCILTNNPEVAYLKWDCNSPITNIYSPYLKNKQGQLYIDYVRGIYRVLKRVKEKYPEVPMMLCSGGGARCDYEALKYFTEFWCSDNTDPIERLFIQWGFSQVFPAKAMAAHVTSWNKNTSVKFRTDVASMCKLGFDLGLKDLNNDELVFCRQAVANWTRLKGLILDGQQYCLVSPYEGNHMSVMYVNQDKSKAILFTYDINPRFAEKLLPVKLQGLDSFKRYKIKEINLMPNVSSDLIFDNQIYSGDYLMKVGIDAFTTNRAFSRVIEITAE